VSALNAGFNYFEVIALSSAWKHACIPEENIIWNAAFLSGLKQQLFTSTEANLHH